MIVASVTKEIIAMEKDNEYKNKLYKFIQKKIDEIGDEKKEKNQLDGWI